MITDFEEKSENLCSSIDFLQLVEAIKCPHKPSAVSLIKSKLKGNARNLTDEDICTIADIINKLKVSVKAESVEFLLAKLRS